MKMNLLLRINTQEELIVLVIIIMVIHRTILSIKVRKGGKLSNLKYAVRMFLVSDLGIISMVILYIITAALSLSFGVTSILILIFLILFFIAYKKA